MNKQRFNHSANTGVFPGEASIVLKLSCRKLYFVLYGKEMIRT